MAAVAKLLGPGKSRSIIPGNRFYFTHHVWCNMALSTVANLGSGLLTMLCFPVSLIMGGQYTDSCVTGTALTSNGSLLVAVDTGPHAGLLIDLGIDLLSQTFIPGDCFGNGATSSQTTVGNLGVNHTAVTGYTRYTGLIMRVMGNDEVSGCGCCSIGTVALLTSIVRNSLGNYYCLS